MTRLIAAGVLVLAMASVPGDAAPTAVLEVRAPGRGLVWQAPISPGEPFDLAFVHSVERSRWTHHYRARPGALEQTGSTFSAFGAGVPVASADGSPLVRTRDGYLAAAPLRIPVLRMLNSRAAEVTLRYRSGEVPLGRLLGDFESFEIRVR